MPATVDLESLVRERAAKSWALSVPLASHALDTTKFTAEVLDFEYEKLNITMRPSVLASSTYINDTTGAASQQFADSKTTTATFTWSIQKSTSFSISVNAKVGLPFVGESSVAVSTTISLSESSSKSETTSQTWSWNSSIPVPARSRVEAKVVVQEARYSPHFTAKVRYKGVARFVYDVNAHAPGWASSDCQFALGSLFGLYPDDNVKVISGDCIEVTIEGVFEGVQGVSYIVEAHQFDLNTGRAVRVDVIEPVRIAHLDLSGLINFRLLDEIGQPDGTGYEVVGRREVMHMAVECEFNDLGVPNPGIFDVETRLYREYQGGKLVRTWTEEAETFDRCVPV
jgi:hypothetical protein